MPETTVKVVVGSVKTDMDKIATRTWVKRLVAPDMPGEYPCTVEVIKSDGEVITLECNSILEVYGKLYDLGVHGKMNENLFKRIVFTFYGYACHVIFTDSVLRLLVRVGSQNSTQIIEDIKTFLRPLIPAHLMFYVERYPVVWENVLQDFEGWKNVLKNLDYWWNVQHYVPKYYIKWHTVKRKFLTFAEIATTMKSWKEVLLHDSSDFAIFNEIKSGCLTWASVARKYDCWDEVLVYTPVQPLVIKGVD